MRQITDDMVKMVRTGSGLTVDGWLISLEHPYLVGTGKNKDFKLKAVWKDGSTTLTITIGKFSDVTLKQAIGGIIGDINSRTHLPESAYNNGIRLDTEHRCQNPRCNPAGKRRLLFVSAGPVAQPMQIKCNGCRWMNTFWNNRIDFDESGVLYMKTKRSHVEPWNRGLTKEEPNEKTV